MLESLQVIVTNTAATTEAIRRMQDAISTAVHAAAQTSVGLQSNNGNGQGVMPQLAGYTMSPPGHVPGTGAPSPVAAPSQGGASTGYSVPPAAPQPGMGGGYGGGFSGGGGGFGGPPGGGGGHVSQPSYGQTPQPGQTGSSSNMTGLLGKMRGVLGGGSGALLRGGAFSSAMGLMGEIYSKAVQESENAARYQGMEGLTGGDGRLQGVLERGREALYSKTERLQHGLSGLTSAEASQAFADVTSFGYRDDPLRGRARQFVDPTRTDALNFMANNKVNLGMSENESFTALEAAAKNGRASLVDLADALSSVSKAAGEAGVNALMARQNFLTMFSNYTQGGAGQGAVEMARANAQSLTGYGRDMQNIDLSAQDTTAFQYRAAAMGNMTIGAYQNLRRHDPKAALAITDTATSRTIEGAIGPQAIAWIKKRANDPDYGGVAKIKGNPDLLQNLADEFQDQFQNQLNLTALMDIIRNGSGVTITENQVTKWVVGHVLGFNGSSEVGKGTAAAGGAVTVGPDGITRSANTGQVVSGTPLAATGSGNTGQDRTRAGGKALNKSQQAYFDLVHKKGLPANYHEPAIEALLNRVKDPDKTQVLVHSGGGYRKVSVSDAIKYFPNEIAKGDIVFAEGQYTDDQGQTQDVAGKGFTDVTGVSGDSKRNTNYDVSRTDVSKVGTKIDPKDPKYQKLLNPADPNNPNNPDGGLLGKFDLTDTAKKLLKLIPSGSVTSGDAASGQRPSPMGILDEVARGIMGLGGIG
jgi:hypothetical protein